jgi:hypothetical protein
MGDVSNDDQRGLDPANWRATTLALSVGILLYWWSGWNVLSTMALAVGFGGALVNLYVDLRNAWVAKQRAQSRRQHDRQEP